MFFFKRVVCGAPIDPVAPFRAAYAGVQAGATGAALQTAAMTQAIMFYSIAKGLDNIVARPSAYADIWPLWNGNYLSAGLSADNGMIPAFNYNYALNPPTTGYSYYAPRSTGLAGNFTRYLCYDQRQILDLDKFNPYVNSWYNECALTSIQRPLFPLANVPIAMVYTSGDEYIMNLPNYVYTDATDIFNSALTTGSLGVGYSFSGAGKTLIINTTSYTGASVPQIDAISAQIASQANNTAIKIRISAPTVDHTQFLAAFGGTTGGGPRLQYSVLNQLPAF